jgi:hypothetical protein
MPDPAMSPAQKVLAAFLDAPLVSRCYPTYRRHQVAAVLRAAADEVVPEIDEPEWGACTDMHCDIELYTAHVRTRRQFLAIAAELEAQP